jgi:ABC-2 type transport system ATP-binding protein
VEKLADRVSIIRLGRIVQSGTLAEMRHLTRTTIEAETERPATGLDALPGIHDLRTADGRVHFAVDGARVDGAVRKLTEFGIRSLVSHPPTLEELMLRHYGDELTSAAAAAGTADGHPGNGDGAVK